MPPSVYRSKHGSGQDSRFHVLQLNYPSVTSVSHLILLPLFVHDGSGKWQHVLFLSISYAFYVYSIQAKWLYVYTLTTHTDQNKVAIRIDHDMFTQMYLSVRRKHPPPEFSKGSWTFTSDCEVLVLNYTAKGKVLTFELIII